MYFRVGHGCRSREETAPLLFLCHKLSPSVLNTLDSLNDRSTVALRHFMKFSKLSPSVLYLVRPKDLRTWKGFHFSI